MKARELLGQTRLGRATIWYESPVDVFPKEFQYTPKVYYPIYYALSLALGVTANAIGSPILVRNFDPVLVDVSGIILALIAATAFVGVAFPRLPILELFGLVGIAVMLGCFATAVLTTQPSDPRVPINLFIYIIILMAICPTLSRMTILLAADDVWATFARIGRILHMPRFLKLPRILRAQES